MSLDHALVLRGVAGPLSFGAMFVGEWGIRRLVFGKRALQGGGAAA